MLQAGQLTGHLCYTFAQPLSVQIYSTSLQNTTKSQLKKSSPIIKKFSLQREHFASYPVTAITGPAEGVVGMDENRMLEGLRQRDATCQQAFWEKYWTRVFAICARILGKGTDSTDLAVDLLTEFIDRRVHNVEKAGAMGGYLRLMAVRRALDLKRYRARTQTLCYEISDTSVISPEDQAVLTNLMPRLDLCLPNLTDKAQQTLRLKYMEQWSNEQIGTIVGGSRQYIGRLLKQSLDFLRLCIEKGVENAPTTS